MSALAQHVRAEAAMRRCQARLDFAGDPREDAAERYTQAVEHYTEARIETVAGRCTGDDARIVGADSETVLELLADAIDRAGDDEARDIAHALLRAAQAPSRGGHCALELSDWLHGLLRRHAESWARDEADHLLRLRPARTGWNLSDLED